MNSETVKKELTLPGGKRLAYCLLEGASPCVIFMGGFKSDMTGSKALALEAFCQARGQRFLRFDYSGHGQSSGDFKEGTIGEWKQDALAIFDTLSGEQNILVGSSMGAWLMLLIARERLSKVAGLVGIASAPDFTERLIWQVATDAQKKDWREKGVVYAPSCYGEEPYPITWKLIEEARKHLLLDNEIAIDKPVRLIHGTKDEDVPWQMSVTLMERLQSPDIQLNLIKNGNHRLSAPEQLQLLCETVGTLLKK